MTLLLLVLTCMVGLVALCLAGAAAAAVWHCLPEILTLLVCWWLLHAVGCL